MSKVKTKEDYEELKLKTEQKLLVDLVGHAGWHIARQKLTQKILDLQNIFDVDDVDRDKMFYELKGRKIATVILWEFLREIEGTVAQVEEKAPEVNKSHIVRLQ